ncbi:MAG: diguanylate cyclase [Clostridia bacterium]|jgi:diguanylate cyclase (GGDEF)-like protein|nr:diguanylate cyclase [Clostridia bacterium]
MTGLLIIVIILIIIIGALSMMLVIKNKQIGYYTIVSKNLSAMRVIQSMFEIMGANIPAENKVNELNKVILDTYEPKYSSIVSFDGSNHEIKATNVDKSYIESIAKIGDENDFRGNAYKNVSKYITTSSDKTLRYKSAIERNIKSCMFSPIYHGSTYLGFWILEDETENAFDSISKSELSKLKNNMGVFLENTLYQNIVEAAQNTDKQTGFYNNLFLYSKARQKLLENENNSIVLLCFNNLAEVNSEYDRNVGNAVLAKAVNIIRELVSSETMCIRYSGARIILLMPNSTAETVHATVERMLARIKSDAVENINNKFVSLNTQILIHTFKKQNNIEREVQKMVSYIDGMRETDTIKII